MSLHCLQNPIGTSAFANVSYLMVDVEAISFCIKKYWTQAKMLLLADVDEYSFTNTRPFQKAFINISYYI